MKFSGYNIFSKENSDIKYILQGYTGCIDVLDDDTYDEFMKINKMSDNEQHQILLKHKYKSLLIDRGYVVHSDIEDTQKYIAVANALKKNVVRSIVIIPSMQCNFRCGYCFELKDLNNERDIMEISTIEQIFRNIDELDTVKQITLFGGEPLQKENISIVEKIVEEAKIRKIEVSAVTNGYDLGHYKKIFEENSNFSSIQITLDGLKDTHDKLRKLKNGGASFDEIVTNIKCMSKIEHLNISIRYNMSKTNYKEFVKLKKYLESKDILGEKIKVSLYNKCIHTAYIKRNENKFFDSDSFDENNAKNHNMTYNTHVNQIRELLENTRKTMPFRTSVCGATGSMLVFTPQKEVFTCWEQIHNSSKKIGVLTENGIVFNQLYETWGNRHVQNLDDCSKCNYSLLCGGGCAHHAELTTGNINSKYCQDTKKIIDLVINEIVIRKEQKE